ISDGWSTGVIIRELTTLYQAYVAGTPASLPPLPVQYADFAVWQRAYLQGEVLERQLRYWREQLAGASSLVLPFDHPRSSVSTARAGYQTLLVSAECSHELKELSRREGSTLFMTLLAALQTLLARYSGQTDVSIGSGIANRTQSEIEGLIGFFVNMLVLRTDLSGNPSFIDLLARTREVILKAFAHQDLPFEQIVEDLQPERKMNEHPFFQVTFVLQNAPTSTLALPGLEWQPVPNREGMTRFDLELHFVETPHGLRGTLIYNTQLFEAATIDRMMEHFQVLLESIVRTPQQGIFTLPLLTTGEWTQLLNRTDQGRSFAGGAHQLFGRQVERAPDAVALVFQSHQITYRVLDHLASQLAHLLRRCGVGLDVPVGICMERTPELIIALLGILKAGGAYVPLDPEYPPARLTSMIADSGMPLLLTLRLPEYSAIPTLRLEEIWPQLCQEVDEPLAVAVPPDALAYMIYTSGSTGQPKGVGVEHAALCNLINWHQQAFAVTSADRATFLAGLSFDATVWELWPYLAAGASIVSVDAETRLLPELLCAWLQQQAITISFVPTPLLERLLVLTWPPALALRFLLTGGDRLHMYPPSSFPCPVINNYGPTENAVVATSGVVEAQLHPERLPTLGKSIQNVQAYLLDAYGMPVPRGVVGELYLGGWSVARGYLGQAALTAERFVPDTFTNEPGRRLYRTGDRGRFLPDGSIEFLGRHDYQVKVRGYRIELSEIEATLQQHPIIHESVVLAHTTNNDEKQLAAYMVLKPNAWQGTELALDWQDEHLGQWQLLYDETYQGKSLSDDVTLNTAGWNSSYTGDAIAIDEMREQIEQTVSRIRALKPQRVLEIGCGTGLLLLRIAPDCVSYLATDFSAQALQGMQSLVRARGLSQVQLLQQAAHDFSGLEEQSVDVVILNAVVQYFPSLEYLLEVLAGSLRILKPEGYLFIGDVRSQELLQAYCASVEAFRAQNDWTQAQLRQHVQQRMQEEEELLLHPAFFQQWGVQHGQVQIQWRRGRAHNELTRFRYDVLIAVGQQHNALEAGFLFDWQEGQLSRSAIATLLSEQMPALVRIKRIPNARLSTEVTLLDWLDGMSGPETLFALRELAQQEPANSEWWQDPEDWWQLAEQLGYCISLEWSAQGDIGCFDVVLWRPEGAESLALPPLPVSHHENSTRATLTTWSEYATHPLQGKMIHQLVPLLSQFVRERLPEYMLPTFWYILERFPQTLNGKLDRQSLPTPQGARTAQTGPRVAPGTAIEMLVSSVWREVLGVEQHSIHDNFFELGGHSLLAMQVIARLRSELGIELPVRNLFESPTIKELASQIEVLVENPQRLTQPPLVAVERDRIIPLSFAQQRLWFLDQFEPESTSYIILRAFRVSGAIDAGALERSLTALVHRHECLRTTFELQDDLPVQVLHPAEGSCRLPLIDLQGVAASTRQQTIHALLQQEAQRPYSLATGPLLRAALLRLDAQEHILFWTVHHIVFDGRSNDIFVRELSALYRACAAGTSSTLPRLPIQYADFAVWQRVWLQGDILTNQLDYWRQQLVGSSPLDLPTDHRRPMQSASKGAACSLSLPEDLQHSLIALSQREGVTLFMMVLAAFQVLLARYCGQTDIAVGTPIANRTHPELEGLIGFFSNTLVMRGDLSGNPSFAQFLQQIREVALGAYAHQDIPFEQLVEELQPERNLSRTPLFQVMLVLQQEAQASEQVEGLTLSSVGIERSTTKFDLTLTVSHGARGMRCGFEYNTDLFERETIQRLLEHWEVVLGGICASPHARLSQLPLLSPAQRQDILTQGRPRWQQPAPSGSLHAWVAQVAERQPDHIAISAGQVQLSYQTLLTQA
ncbi:MAG TPA: amino acid adenylation domain-containing protein, partial [Ktedonobacteraceae bacterium]|nr:amino acid adenylation domain-containing protein [Ktedonobacteraceae bacterium]